MFNVKDFLNKFNDLKPKDDILKEEISNIIFLLLNIKIEKKYINIKNNSIYIKTSNIIKNEIFFKKSEILNKINIKTNKILKNII